MISSILKEYWNYPVGKYPTSDEVNTQPNVSPLHEFGVILELKGDKKVNCIINKYNESIMYGSFTCDGVDAEVFELTKARNTYFNKFKTKIEAKYGKKLLDEGEARKAFNTYVNRALL
jgi:hypothetical protein